ncbi:MAG: PD-(D/E)XK nuclease family protein [Phycisphaeraceae bacterium]
MSIERVFLGWDQPGLHRAVDHLFRRFGSDERTWDLGRVLLVVPAQRAGRRLLELLVTRAEREDRLLVPPRIVTVGSLPEELYEPATPPADDLQSSLAWVHALRSMSAEDLRPLIPHPPDSHAISDWWALARQVRSLRDDLAGHRMRFTDVPRHCAERGVDLRGEERWAVLGQIEKLYLDTLAELGLADRQAQRMEVLQRDQLQCDQTDHIVLIACADINDLVAAYLRAVAVPVTALVMAPEEHASGFDELGVFRPGYWQGQHVDITPEQVRFVGRETEQADEVAHVIAQASKQAKENGAGLGADEVTVGLGDERSAGPIRRRLGLEGVPSRSAAGTPVSHSRPALLLGALSRYKLEHRFDTLAELLRHPDIDLLLRREGHDKAIGDWLTLLDRYATDHLQGRLTEQWLGKPERQKQLKAVYDRIESLMPIQPAERLPLPEFSELIAGVLRQVYADTPLREYDPDERSLAYALETIADRLREQAELAPKARTCPKVTAAQAIALTLSRLHGAVIPDEHDGPAVELLGYLELPLDDAPVLAITGMNEGLIPTLRTADPFLPDSVRAGLGMPDNQHRFARDLMLLNAIVHSRPTTRLIAARTSHDGDPLKPSRLLLACDDPTLIRRVKDYFREDAPQTHRTSVMCPGSTNRFLIPPPQTGLPIITELPVTAFKSYLACPYRFYLRYVLKLESLDDRAIEMDRMSFGTLAHAVLQQFGNSDLRNETHAETIADFLSEELNRLVERRFGRDLRPALRIQTEQMRQRLHAFAIQQARLVGEGWRITHVEQELSAEVEVDGQPFTIKGKIDRIDYHETYGYRIYDYKTGDNGKKPEKTHHTGKGESRQWHDLQLPLYAVLCRQLDIARPVLGYFNLPKKLSEVAPVLAGWDDGDLAQAFEVRDDVIRNIRNYVFWPPKEPPQYPDGYERVCADHVMQRDVLIRDSEPSDTEVTG